MKLAALRRLRPGQPRLFRVRPIGKTLWRGVAHGLREVRDAILRSTALFLGAVLVASVLTGALAHTAQASTLTGEVFLASTIGDVVAVECPAFPATTFTYHVEGRATGPHSGTFTEDGTVVLDPSVGIVSLDATFEIMEDGVVTVTGEKHFVGPPGDTAFCSGDFAEILTERLCYRAEFADGSRDEIGRASIDLFGETGDFASFAARFTPDATVSGCGAPPSCPDEEDDDGDGLVDSQESRFFALLGSADSDLDGVADGNDDANGNGEDDEDEDDDEQDGCPDEDSDDDGEDDEDEDDEDDDD